MIFIVQYIILSNSMLPVLSVYNNCYHRHARRLFGPHDYILTNVLISTGILFYKVAFTLHNSAKYASVADYHIIKTLFLCC